LSLAEGTRSSNRALHDRWSRGRCRLPSMINAPVSRANSLASCALPAGRTSGALSRPPTPSCASRPPIQAPPRCRLHARTQIQSTRLLG
jgi:hypothetical protein